MPDDDSKLTTGCGILFVLALVIINVLGMVPLWAGPYAKLVFGVGCVGCVCGATLGGYISTKTRLSTKRTPGFWIAFCGLLGLVLSASITVRIVQFWPR
jgi:hypothetical protein